MKKTTKALYAAAAGLALITSAGGGRATYASWIDTAHLSNATIETGDLRLDFWESNGQVTWYLLNCANASYLPDPDNVGQYLGTRNFKTCAGVNVVNGNVAFTSPVAGPVTNFATLGLLQPGYTLLGMVDVKTTLAGDTIEAMLDFTWDNPTVWANQQYYSAPLQEWLTNAARTKHVRYVPAITQPVAIGVTKYHVEIQFDFPTAGFPAQTGTMQAGGITLGDIDLELLQVVSGNPFNGNN